MAKLLNVLGWGVGMVLVLVSGAHAQAGQLRPGWRADMEPQTAAGHLHWARQVELKVWNEGYYDETANALELTLEGVRLPVLAIASSYDLECRTFLHIAEGVLVEDATPWARAGDRVRLSFRDEVFSRCWEVPVQTWSLKVEIRNGAGELETVADFKGSPHRIRP
jgi:hypothetical protein